MRELEFVERTRKYYKRKPLPKKYIITGYLLVLALLVFTLITKNKFILFLFITLLATIVNYQTNLPTIRFNPDPEVFGSLFITRFIGLHYGLFMLIVPICFVDIYTARLDKDTFISLIFSIIINYIMSKSNWPFMVLGIILVTTRFVLSVILGFLVGTSIEEIVFEHVLGFLSNIVMFLTLSNLFISLFI